MSIKEQVIQEKKEVDERLAKLHTFIQDNDKFVALGREKANLLIEQEKIMAVYSDVLQRRLALIGDSDE